MQDLVERWYSSAAYPLIQHLLTPISNLTPIAFLDVLALALVAGFVLLWVRALGSRGRRARAAGKAAIVTLAGIGVIYVLFQIVWGLNYQRVRLPEKLVLDREAPSTAEVVALGRTAVERLNALHDAAYAQGWREPVWKNPSLVSASGDVQRMLGENTPAVVGRLKHSLFGVVFRWNGVDGMVNPFGLEVLANPDLLAFERPFVAAHEWAHLAGYADESEANFVGRLTTVRADVPSQYSGWMYLYWQIAGEIGQRDREALFNSLAAGPRRDLAAIADRLRRGEWQPFERVSWAAYDKYLK